MTIAICASLLANLQATTAVRDAIAKEGVDAVYVLGDLVGYGGDPAAVVELVRSEGWRCVAGHWDYAVASTDWDSEAFNPISNCSRWWTRGALSAEQRAWLAGLPEELVEERLASTFVNASPGKDHLRPHVFSAEEVAREMDQSTAQRVFIGHTNVPMACTESADGWQIHPGLGELTLAGARQLINVGAVGQPRDGDPRACFLLYEPGSARISWQRVDYDVAGAQAAIRAGGLPERIADRLALGR